MCGFEVGEAHVERGHHVPVVPPTVEVRALDAGSATALPLALAVRNLFCTKHVR
jgi:hypothetical protein